MSDVRVCTKCNRELPLTDFRTSIAKRGTKCLGRKYYCHTCKECDNTRRRDHYYDNWDQAHWRHIERLYGLTKIEWIEMFEAQGKRCACCPRLDPGWKRGWLVDHDHQTGVIRGIVCMPCNRLLGAAADNVDTLSSAIDYLKWDRSNARVVPASQVKPRRSKKKKPKARYWVEPQSKFVQLPEAA